MSDFPGERLARVRFDQEPPPGTKPPAVHDGVLSIAGCKKYGDVGQTFLGFSRQVWAAQRARHHDVGEDQVYRDAAIDNHECARRISRLDHAVAKLGEHRDRDLANLIVIFNHEDGFLSASNLVGPTHDQRVFAFYLSREVQLHSGSGTYFSVDFDMSAGLLEEAVNHGEAKSRALV